MKSLLIDSKLKQCSFEDVLEHFQDTVKFKSIQFASYNRSLGYDVEDIEQELRIVLYNSYMNYSDTDIHFSTYLYHSIENHLSNILRRYQTNKREGIFTEYSLDREVYDDSGETLLEQQSSLKDTETTFFANYVLEVVYSIAHMELEKDIIKYFLDYMTVKEIAAKHNVSRRTVYNHINKLREELKEKLY